VNGTVATANRLIDCDDPAAETFSTPSIVVRRVPIVVACARDTLATPR
jgi:hypothetical protein